jgi:hypothetical protein
MTRATPASRVWHVAVAMLCAMPALALLDFPAISNIPSS